MEILSNSRLFWFVKDGTKFNFNNQSHKDMYIQQVLTNGNMEDIKNLLKLIKIDELRNSFNRIKKFLPKEISLF